MSGTESAVSGFFHFAQIFTAYKNGTTTHSKKTKMKRRCRMNRHWRQLVILPMLIFLLVLPIQAFAAKSLYQWAKRLEFNFNYHMYL